MPCVNARRERGWKDGRHEPIDVSDCDGQDFRTGARGEEEWAGVVALLMREEAGIGEEVDAFEEGAVVLCQSGGEFCSRLV